MSFGVGIGDIALVVTFTWKLYKNCKESSEDFRRMTTELLSLHAVLSETCELFEEQWEELQDCRKKRIFTLIENCQHSLQDLYALYCSYNTLSTQAQRVWDRLRFGMKDLSEVRQKLISSTTLLTSYYTILNSSSNRQIVKKLTKYATEVQAGMREGSVICIPDVAANIQSPDVWAELRPELEDVGISAVVGEERREFILNWLKNSLAEGLLEESARVVGNYDASISSRSTTPSNDDGLSTRSITPTNDVEQNSSCYHTAPNGSVLSHDSEVMSVANSAFAADVQRTLNERSIAELLAPLAVSNIYSLHPPSSSSSVVRRRRTFSVVEKLFQKPTAIIKAASDGDINRVGRLISIGVDVNAVDRWGWSALSMCGYGGHAPIARLLLDHGAKIDNVDVDGDTPKSLAMQRGHSDVVNMLDDEEETRKLRARETQFRLPGVPQSSSSR
ncbi:hypothetical protein B0H11DRAFT_192600 [Mycena galericulata]|nr:hypothetical protein B0H11DRAFT_192600 [Mycena galericulata]